MTEGRFRTSEEATRLTVCLLQNRRFPLEGSERFGPALPPVLLRKQVNIAVSGVAADVDLTQILSGT
jgi:hypothetical protein